MSNQPNIANEEHLLARYLATELSSRLSGRSEQDCLRNSPHDVYFIGNLRSEDSPQGPQGDRPHLPELLNKLSPVAFGGDFRVRLTERGTLSVRLSWACYYRVFPSFQEQLRHSQDLVGKTPSKTKNRSPIKSGSNPADEDDTDDASIEAQSAVAEEAAEARDSEADEGQVGRNDVLMIKFRKLNCEATGKIALERRADGIMMLDHSSLNEALADEIKRVRMLALSDPERISCSGEPYSPIRVPQAAMGSSNAYDGFKKSLATPIEPNWAWEVRCESWPDPDDPAVEVLSVLFANCSPRQLSAAGKDNPCIEPFLFDTSAVFDFEECAAEPFSIELAPKGFRHDRTMWARPFNCAIEPYDSPGRFRAAHVPIFSQARLVTQAAPSAEFSDLAADPVPVLKKILVAMESYQTVWNNARQAYEAADPSWKSRHGAEFDTDFQKYENEIARFRRGCRLIESNADVELAFRLTNETFAQSGRHSNKTSWRLFQLVFLVTQIAGLSSLLTANQDDRAELNAADIIYFPTGGGKTEAYLSVITFHCFLDRLRRKTGGVTAWTRFPLRLLTLQQTQRVADVVCVADLVRRASTDKRLSGSDVAGFGVGYFVGKASTPNELINANEYRYSQPDDVSTWALANDDAQRQVWRRLIHCPSCRTKSVRVDLDIEKTRLIHRCTAPNCKFPNGQIPVYVVDNEIYRYLPSVLVGTIDKLAGIGMQRKMALIFGHVDGYCRIHGYYKGRCCQKECTDPSRLVPSVPRGLSGPTLFVQDELHLLKEGLGTFDGHYETFVQELRIELKAESPLKIIASSATIENFERQVEHLYGTARQLARIFPGPGPKLGESFYAHTLDYPQRLYVGLIPHNKTIFNAMLELLEHYHRIVQELILLKAGDQNPYGGLINPSSDPWYEVLDKYVTSLAYFLSSRDLNSIHTDLDGHVSPLLQSLALNPLRVMELTGSSSTDEVASTLEYLDRPKPRTETATSILATNMVSHGVDIDRFNAMFFYGMPRQNAEYIQASSRVGRSHVGLVFVCHHPARERDRSHYAVFSKFHEYLGQLVEPVAINRWATFSVNRTLPGLFMGVLLQIIANRADPKQVNNYYLTKHVRKLITSASIRSSDFIPFLERAYRVDTANETAKQQFRREINLRVQQFLDNIIQAADGKTFVSSTLIPRPMTSLRDVDEPIPILLDRAGTQWASRAD